MRKILINRDLDVLALKYYQQLENRAIVSKIRNELYELIKDIDRVNHLNYIRYLLFIRQNLRDIIIMHPVDFKSFDAILALLFNCDIGWHAWKSGKTESFAQRLCKAMCYDDVRKNVFPRIVPALGIKTCVYCNMQYALTRDDNAGMSAYYELDHAWPKSKYPYFAVSFYNLQPCCGPCNRRKSDDELTYSIYEEEPKPSSVRFEIDNESLIEYILTHKTNSIQVGMKVKDPLLDMLYDRIGVKKLYKLMDEDAEEMIWKAKIYNTSYLTQLYQTNKGLFENTSSNIFRLLYGVYSGEENVYTRPLTKFRQDIAKQLNLL